MSSTATSSPPSASKPVPPWRVYCDVAFKWIALLGLVLSLLQVAFAALGFWGSVEKPGDQIHGMEAFEPHVLNGMILYYIAAVLFVLGLLAMAGWKNWVIPLVMFVLLFGLQGMLGGLGFGVSKWFGFLHAIVGVAVILGFARLYFDRMKRPLKAS